MSNIRIRPSSSSNNPLKRISPSNSSLRKPSPNKEYQSKTVKAPPIRASRLPTRPSSALEKPTAMAARSRTSPPEPIGSFHHVTERPSSLARTKHPSHVDTIKQELKPKTELRSSIPKPIGRLNTVDSIARSVSKLKPISSIQSRILKPITSLDRKTSTIRTEQFRSRQIPKPRAVNTMTSSIPGKPTISYTATRRSPLLKTNKNSIASKNEIDGTNSKELTQELEMSICNQQSVSKEQSLKNDVLCKEQYERKITVSVEQTRMILEVFSRPMSTMVLPHRDIRKRKTEEFRDVTNPNVSEVGEMLEIDKMERTADLIKSADQNSPSGQESGAGETTLDIMTAENMEDSSELINDLASRIRTVPSSTMDLCREAVLQREKFIYDCLSKINDISQSNFENIRNELKETLTSYNNEGNQLPKKLDILEAQQREVLGSLVSDITHLIEEKRKLVDKNKRLSITQDKYHNELQYKIDLLVYENETAAKNFTETVEMFEREKAKMEADFNASKVSDQTILAVRRKLTTSDLTLNGQEKKIAALETLSKTLEHAIKVKENHLEKELRKCKEIMSKKQDQTQQIEEIKAQLENEQGAKSKLDEDMQSLQSRIKELEVQLEEEIAQKHSAENQIEKLSRDYSKLQEAFEESKNQLETSNRSVQLPDNLPTRVNLEMGENQTQDMDLKDVEIKLLKNKINDLTEQMEQMNTVLVFEAKQRAEYTEEAASLHTQLTNLHHTLHDVTKEKEELEKIMVQKTLELEQRDHVLHTQTRSLVVRDELIQILKTKDENQEDNVNKLGATIIMKEKNIEKDEGNQHDSRDPENGDSDYSSGSYEGSKNLCFNSSKMSELYTMLEKKHIMIMRLEKRMQELEGIHEKTEHQRIRHEARINQLEQALNEKCLTNPGLIPILVQ